MDAMTFLGFMGITVTGLVTLGVILKLLETDYTDVRAEQTLRADAEPAVRSAAALPAFFVNAPAVNTPPAVVGFDDELVALLEAHVKSERAMATRFVHYPSVDSLYRPARSAPRMH